MRHLASTLPVKKIGEKRYIPHYLDYNLPIEVDTAEFANQMKINQPGVLEEVQANEHAMTYFGHNRLTKIAVPRQEVTQEQSGLATA